MPIRSAALGLTALLVLAALGAGCDGQGEGGCAIEETGYLDATEETGEDGSFALSLDAAAGDSLSLSLVGVTDAVPVEWEVEDLATFPAIVSATAAPNLDFDATLVVEILFEEAQTGGQVWVANPANDAASFLTPFQGGLWHGGPVPGLSGDVLLAFWTGSDSAQTGAIEIVAD